jgi:hypothetical protein
MEENTLIAEFMGFQKTDIGWYDSEETLTSEVFGSDNTFDFLNYHKSWDWLMPVVEKIMWDNDITDDSCTKIADALCDAKIDRVYDAIVEFIKWYNQNT